MPEWAKRRQANPARQNESGVSGCGKSGAACGSVRARVCVWLRCASACRCARVLFRGGALPGQMGGAERHLVPASSLAPEVARERLARVTPLEFSRHAPPRTYAGRGQRGVEGGRGRGRRRGRRRGSEASPTVSPACELPPVSPSGISLWNLPPVSPFGISLKYLPPVPPFVARSSSRSSLIQRAGGVGLPPRAGLRGPRWWEVVHV